MKNSVPYTYESGLDILSLSTKGDYEESAAVAGFLTADFDAQGRCIGFEFLDAAELFLPYLCPDEYAKPDLEEDLAIVYRPESDTLRLHNSGSVSYSENVLDHCVAHLDAEGNPVGFTLERAKEHLLPLFLDGCSAKKRPVAE